MLQGKYKPSLFSVYKGNVSLSIFCHTTKVPKEEYTIFYLLTSISSTSFQRTHIATIKTQQITQGIEE